MSKYEIASKLRALRESQNLDQKDVANYLGVTPQKVSSFETGRTRIDVDTLALLAKLYNVDVNYILGFESNEDLSEYLDELHKRPEMRILFSVAKAATKEDIETAVKIIKALKRD